MRKRVWLILLVAATLMAVLTATVMAQNTVIDENDETPGAAVVQIDPITATVRQQVPVSVTVHIPLGTTGTQTVTIPMLLNLNFQISLGELVSPSLALTAEVSAVGPVAPLATPARTVTATTAAPTPTRAPATATPLPPSPTPTLAPTPTLTESVTTTETVTSTETTTTTVTTPVTDTTTVIMPECTDPRSMIIYPGVNQTISGTVEVVGSATHENFEYYKLEYANGANASPAAEYFYLGGGNSPVENGVLATIDTTSLANGPYTMRLTVVDNTGNFPAPCAVTVEVQN